MDLIKYKSSLCWELVATLDVSKLQFVEQHFQTGYSDEIRLSPIKVSLFIRRDRPIVDGQILNLENLMSVIRKKTQKTVLLAPMVLRDIFLILLILLRFRNISGRRSTAPTALFIHCTQQQRQLKLSLSALCELRRQLAPHMLE